jgi:SAM-dependent methyltransferase
MFDQSATFYDAIYSFKDYAAESKRVDEIIQSLKPGARSLLDVACGTGKHIEHLRERYQDIAGIDLDEALLEIARERNPGVRLDAADMRSFSLGRTFDAVTCLFSAIGYAQSTDELNAACARMAVHLVPGGVIIVEPWLDPAAYQAGGVSALYIDEPDLKIARMNTRDRDGSLSIIDFHYLIGTPEGIEHRTERHTLGLFTHHEYRDALDAAGIEVRFDPDDLMRREEHTSRGLYYGLKRHSSDVTA